MRQLQIGTPYYRLTWSDPDFTIPGVEPWFYVGINLSPEDDPAGVLHYFQDTISYAWCGSLAHSDKLKEIEDVEVCVSTAHDSDLESDWLTLDDIILRLQEARQRLSAKTCGSAS